MNINFQTIIDQLHDARFFGFLFDNERTKFAFDFYVYLQLFDDFENESYQLRKALLRFSNAKIDTLSIKDDLSRGQFFISNLVIQKKEEVYQFDFIFSSNDIKLSLSADDIELMISEKIEYSLDQYLNTDWSRLLE